MKIDIPQPIEVIELIKPIESTFNNKKQPISNWIQNHRKKIKHNNSLTYEVSDNNDIKILKLFFVDLLMRSLTGERGSLLEANFNKYILDKTDLKRTTFDKILKDSGYRWHKDGVDVLLNVVIYFKDKIHWNWRKYFDGVERNYIDNFINDPLLTIKNISFKVRDLALSNFNEYYIANDVHIVRVSTRIGFLNYGFDLCRYENLEMGNNPMNVKNYLFLHKLFLKISELTDNEYLPVDFDRAFWHFGRTVCSSKPKCQQCVLKKICLTGKTLFN